MCNNVAGYNACPVTIVIYMIDKNTRLLTFLIFIIERDKNIKTNPYKVQTETTLTQTYESMQTTTQHHAGLTVKDITHTPSPPPNETGTVFRRVNTIRSLFYITVFSINHTNSETIFNIFHRSDTKVEK